MLRTLERQLICYPKHINFKIFIALCYRDQRGKSELLQEILNDFIKSIPEEEKQALLIDFTKLEAMQKKKPNRKER